MTRTLLIFDLPAPVRQAAVAHEEWRDCANAGRRSFRMHALESPLHDVPALGGRRRACYGLAGPADSSTQRRTLGVCLMTPSPGSSPAPGSDAGDTERDPAAQGVVPAWSTSTSRAPVVHIAGHSPSEDEEAAFGGWVDRDHVQAVLRVPGVVAVRRFGLTRPPLRSWPGPRMDGPRVLTVSYLDTESVVDEPDFVHEQARARAMAYVPDQEPYVLLGKHIHTTADGISIYGNVLADPDARTGERSRWTSN
jgi:hypothetical protein